jgi:competence protein ComEC
MQHSDAISAEGGWDAAPARIPAVYLTAIALVAGDATGSLHPGVPLWAAAALAAAAAVAFAARQRWAMPLAMAALAAAAMVAAQRVYAPPAGAATIRFFPPDRMLLLEGELDREPERIRDVARIYLKVHRAGLDAAHLGRASGRVRITVVDPADYRLGDRLRVTARIRRPRNYGDPGEFDYESYMAREGIAATALVTKPEQIERIGYRPVFFWSRVESLRRRIGAFIDAGLPYPQRAEMRALIIGDRGAIDRTLREEFALTGMAHMLVISGLHLGFVASVAFLLIRLLCLPFPRLMILGYSNKLAAIGSGAAVTAYAAIAGSHVSTLRALVMVLCYAVAVVADRGREVIASLALAAVLICIALPGSSTDIGFQLSFAAVLGILLGMRRYGQWWEFTHVFVRGRPGESLYAAAEAIGAYLAVSFFALMATAPLTAFYFNQFSLSGLIANPVVVPVMALGGMVLGLFAAALSFVWIAPANALLQVAGWALGAGTRLTAFFVALPGAWIRIFTPNLFELALVYGLLGLWLCAPPSELQLALRRAPRPRPPRGSRRLHTAAAGALFAALAIDAGWWLHQRYFDATWRVTFLSVGQGDAAVVQFPGSAVMVIDGGSVFKDGSDMGERVVGPFLWSRKIMRVDYLVMSHPEADHFGGFISLARNFDPAEFWSTGAASSDFSYQRLTEELAGAGTRFEIVDALTPRRLIGGVEVRCLSPQPGAPGSRNNNSMVLSLRLGRFGFLLTGDLEGEGERLLLARDPSLEAAVLKVPHHGSLTSSTPEFIEAVHPRFAVISDGYDNRYHFPSEIVVRRYEREGATVLRTDRAGAIGFEVNNGHLHWWAYRPPPPSKSRLLQKGLEPIGPFSWSE